jgi:hypothetical protein
MKTFFVVTGHLTLKKETIMSEMLSNQSATTQRCYPRTETGVSFKRFKSIPIFPSANMNVPVHMHTELRI